MYSFELPWRRGARRDAVGVALKDRPSVARVVYWIGFSSLLADISSEAVASTLPIFLFTVLQLSPLETGILDGLYQGTAALVRVAGAYVADRKECNRAVALLGYGLSTLSRLGLMLATQWGLLFALVSLLTDRIGKGIRTAPRDAIIAGHSQPASIGAAFGVHRSLDAVGAFVGPLVAAGLLWLLPLDFVWLFAISMAFGASGILVFASRVHDAPSPSIADQSSDQLPAQSVTRLLWSNRAFVRMLVVAVGLSVFTVGDGLIYLCLQRLGGLDASWVPVLFSVTAFVFMIAAAPVGRLADKFGALPVFIAGYVAVAFLYGLLAGCEVMTTGVAAMAAGLLGLFYAATDGVMAAAIARTLDRQALSTGLALFATATGLTRIAASTLYGLIWQHQSQAMANGVFGIGLGVAILTVLFFNWRSSRGLPFRLGRRS